MIAWLPAEFLQIYYVAVRAVGVSEDVMANYFRIALKDPARSWFINLSLKSIRSWNGLCHEFFINFQGTSKRHDMQIDFAGSSMMKD